VEPQLWEAAPAPWAFAAITRLPDADTVYLPIMQASNAAPQAMGARLLAHLQPHALALMSNC
jgi:hypothetical protein